MKVDKYKLATVNKKNALQIIWANSTINKAEIARQADLSLPTVMKMVDEFEQNGLVRTVGKGKSSGGKPPELLELIPDAHHIIGVDVGRSRLKTMIMDLSGRVVCKQYAATGDDPAPEKVIDKLTEMVEETVRKCGVESSCLLGMGVGMPGLLDEKRRTVLFSPDFHWVSVPLYEHLRARFSLPILIENSNRAQAMGEKWFGAGQNSNYFICVNLGHGIGSAIVEKGEFYRGSSGTSGEFGHITLEPNGPVCDCGNRGCLEVLASGNAIAKQAQELLAQGGGIALREHVQNDMQKIDAKIVFDAAKQGDPEALALVDKVVEYIGIALASYVNLLDPDLIILAGGVTHAGSILSDGIANVLQERKMRFAGRNVKIKLSTLGDDGTAIGAASLVLKAFIESGGTRLLARQ